MGKGKQSMKNQDKSNSEPLLVNGNITFAGIEDYVGHALSVLSDITKGPRLDTTDTMEQTAGAESDAAAGHIQLKVKDQKGSELQINIKKSTSLP